MTTIIVGHDGSDTSKAAVQEAARLAEALGNSLHIVVAFKRDSTKRVHEGESLTIGGIDEAEEIIRDAATKFAVNLDVTHAISTDDPAEALVAEAERLDASMIVVGNKRTQGLSRVLGSVASAVVRKASCSVHIAHTSG
jgi:nucleotide-binding universal stress UspA family protein